MHDTMYALGRYIQVAGTDIMLSEVPVIVDKRDLLVGIRIGAQGRPRFYHVHLVGYPSWQYLFPLVTDALAVRYGFLGSLDRGLHLAHDLGPGKRPDPIGHGNPYGRLFPLGLGLREGYAVDYGHAELGKRLRQFSGCSSGEGGIVD